MLAHVSAHCRYSGLPSLSDADYDFASIAYKDPPNRLESREKYVSYKFEFFCLLHSGLLFGSVRFLSCVCLCQKEI